MALSLNVVPPERGAAWVREAWRIFLRRPLGFTGLFLVFLFGAMLMAVVPVVGGLLQLMLLPLLSLGFMVATQSALRGGPVQPGQYVEPLTTDRSRRLALLQVCVAYGLGAAALLWGSDAVSDGRLTELQRLLASGQATREELDALMADRGVFLGTVIGLLGATLWSVPFWHAPALVHWGSQSAGQALFSSTLAVWRCKGAFVVYALTWSAMFAVFGVVTALLAWALGVPALAALLAVPAGLAFSVVFYVSLLFSFDDSFGRTNDSKLAETDLGAQ